MDPHTGTYSEKRLEYARTQLLPRALIVRKGNYRARANTATYHTKFAERRSGNSPVLGNNLDGHRPAARGPRLAAFPAWIHCKLAPCCPAMRARQSRKRGLSRTEPADESPTAKRHPIPDSRSSSLSQLRVTPKARAVTSTNGTAFARWESATKLGSRLGARPCAKLIASQSWLPLPFRCAPAHASALLARQMSSTNGQQEQKFAARLAGAQSVCLPAGHGLPAAGDTKNVHGPALTPIPGLEATPLPVKPACHRTTHSSCAATLPLRAITIILLLPLEARLLIPPRRRMLSSPVTRTSAAWLQVPTSISVQVCQLRAACRSRGQSSKSSDVGLLPLVDE